MPEVSKTRTNDADSYLLEIVEPTILDFEANPTSRRHAFLASVAVFHTIDYIYGNKAAHNERDKLRETSPSFSIVDRVAHAFKHVQGGNTNRQNNLPLNAKKVISRPRGAIGEFAIGLSRIGDASGGVTLCENVEVDLLRRHRGRHRLGRPGRSQA